MVVFASPVAIFPRDRSLTSSLRQVAASCRSGRGDRLRLLLAFELCSVELGVEAAGGKELIVGTPLQDSPVIDDQDLVRLTDGRQAVRDDQRGAAGQGRLQRP